MMTPQFTPEAFAALGGPNLVYVRPVRASEIVGGQPVESEDGLRIDPDQILYALHRADGARLAIMTDRESARAAARAHELAPVSVH